MGLLLALPAIHYAVKSVSQLNQDINGQWIAFLTTMTRLWLRRRGEHKKNRVMRHDVWTDDVHHYGVMPFQHEWLYECPSKNKSEDLLIYGVNSLKQSIKIEIKWRFDSNRNINPINADIDLSIDDNDGNHYTLEEESNVQFRDREYKASGLTVEVLSPFRKKRIRFRGYLTKNGKQLVYVRFRFIWTSFSRVHDFTTDFDNTFMAKELIKSQNSSTEQLCEDRLSQFGHMKGTFDEESLPQKELFFWGAISKKYLEEKPIDRKIVRIVGYTNKGIGFELGVVSNKKGLQYKYGFLTIKGQNIQYLKNISLKSLELEELLRKRADFEFKATFDDQDYNFTINKLNLSGAHQLIINGQPGLCYVLEENETEYQNKATLNETKAEDSSLVLAFSEDNAKSVDLTGGKGSSLAELMSLSHIITNESSNNTFKVPNGVIVTTNAYKRLLEEYKDINRGIRDLEELPNLPKEEVRTKCLNIVNTVANHKLPQIIRKEIQRLLNKTFGDYQNKLFAVRSSAASEDSEEMSAAGQMTTFLGVRGLDDICESVMKCWSSQFSHIAVEYKRGYGQPINGLMAVVIQEMVNCDFAGVMFTCDPITGDERLIEITGNYGLGESVVSASAEPDTIRLSVNIESNTLSKPRTVRAIEKKTIGAKKMSIKLNESGGTVEEEISDSESCCVSDEVVLRLADLGLRIHRHYGNARDIEWGVKGGEVFMLQSRPVTNLDKSYTDYEIMHEMDSAHQTESEIYSSVHSATPASTSWNTLGWFWTNRSSMSRNLISEGKLREQDYNPYAEVIGVVYNQIMFNMTSSVFGDMFCEYPESKPVHSVVLGLFGHEITDQDMLDVFKERRTTLPKQAITKKIAMILTILGKLFFGPSRVFKIKKEYMEVKQYDLARELRKVNSSRDMWSLALDHYQHSVEAGRKYHGDVSMGASIKPTILKAMLESALENNPHLEEDFSLMLSSCNDVISAEVPNSLRDIAKSIKNKERFRQLCDEEALKELTDGSDEASLKFRHFLDRHGHRGYRELDNMYPPWRDNPLPCIKTIKGVLSGNDSQLESKVDKSVDQVISELKTPLSFTRKLLLKKLILPWSRTGVGYREYSKYFMVWLCDKQRQGFKYLAQTMVREGLIPTADTFFYLTPVEVHDLCNGRRDPILLMKARLRKRLYPKMDKYKFEEFVKGPDMKPKNFEEKIIPLNLTNGTVRMTGTPVSSGTVKARVCVAEDITEADDIQSGDILITYTTDIGWSPYFPLLSGIITEIGGTISHGAVIAREYGIPSLIAVEGACRAFKTGDICVLDTHSQTITKVE